MGAACHEGVVVIEREEDLAKTLACNIRQRRSDLGLTQVELAKRVRISQRVVSGIERGEVWPRRGTLVGLAIALETTPGTLLTEGAFGKVPG